MCVGGGGGGGEALWRDKFMNNIAERHCGHIKAVRLQCQRWCHQKAVSRGGLGTLCVDYVPSYQVRVAKDTTQQQLQSLLWPPEAGHDPRADILFTKCRTGSI